MTQKLLGVFIVFSPTTTFAVWRLPSAFATSAIQGEPGAVALASLPLYRRLGRHHVSLAMDLDPTSLAHGFPQPAVAPPGHAPRSSNACPQQRTAYTLADRVLEHGVRSKQGTLADLQKSENSSAIGQVVQLLAGVSTSNLTNGW